MIAKKLEEADSKKLLRGFETGKYVAAAGMNFLILTSTSSGEVRKYTNGLQFCAVDETTLKTMIRANHGYMLINNGKIEGKWSSNTLPKDKWFKSLTTGVKTSKGNNARLLFAIFYIAVVIYLVLFILSTNIQKYYHSKSIIISKLFRI